MDKMKLIFFRMTKVDINKVSFHATIMHDARQTNPILSDILL